MKVGDLVKLNYDDLAEFEDRVGIITEWADCSGWVQWAGNPDWDIEYEEDLELISESR